MRARILPGCRRRASRGPASPDRTNATRSCHGIVGVRQVDICATAVGDDRHSLRFAGCAVLEARLGRLRQCRVRKRVAEIARQPQWVMDGNYTRNGAGELRRQSSDTVIWFDLPRRSCMLGIVKRIAGSYGQVRPEMAEGCPEKFDFEFFRYVWTYRRQQRPKLLNYFRRAARRSIAGLLHRPDAGERLSEGNRAQAEPGEYPLMPRFSSKRRVHHTASQMFDLVADVERYPEFVPLCQSLRIRQRTPGQTAPKSSSPT